MYRTIIELNYSQLPEEGLFGVLEVTFIEWRFNPFLNGLATKDSCDPGGDGHPGNKENSCPCQVFLYEIRYGKHGGKYPESSLSNTVQ